MTEPHWLTEKEMEEIILQPIDEDGGSVVIPKRHRKRWHNAVLRDLDNNLYSFDPTMTNVFGPFSDLDALVAWQETQLEKP